MTIDRDAICAEYPQSVDLFGCFGEDYDYEYGKDERVATDDFIDSHRNYRAATVDELDRLLSEYPSNEGIREAVKALGVRWSMWDQDNSWIAFVQRLRGWLADSLAADPS